MYFNPAKVPGQVDLQIKAARIHVTSFEYYSFVIVPCLSLLLSLNDCQLLDLIFSEMIYEMTLCAVNTAIFIIIGTMCLLSA